MARLLKPFFILALTMGGAAHGAKTENPVPGHISPQAQEYLAKARLGQMPPREYDPEYMERMRKVLGNMFLRTAREIDPDFVLAAQTFNGVEAYWVNREAPTRPGPAHLPSSPSTPPS